MADRVEVSLDELVGLLATSERNHGVEWTAQWFRDEVMRQPVTFYAAFMQMAERAGCRKPSFEFKRSDKGMKRSGQRASTDTENSTEEER